MDFEKRNQRLRELYDQCSTRELSEQFKISRQRIHKIVNPHGEKSERRKRNAVASLSPTDLEKLFEFEPRLQQIFKDYKAGLPKNEIIVKHQLKSSQNYKEFISRWLEFHVRLEIYHFMAEPCLVQRLNNYFYSGFTSAMMRPH